MKKNKQEIEDDTLQDLHKLLVDSYIKLMKSGCEDPRILKEVRELLKDNSITGDISDTIKSIEDYISLPADYLEVVND